MPKGRLAREKSDSGDISSQLLSAIVLCHGGRGMHKGRADVRSCLGGSASSGVSGQTLTTIPPPRPRSRFSIRAATRNVTMPVTDFTVEEAYDYLCGFQSHHESAAVSFACEYGPLTETGPRRSRVLCPLGRPRRRSRPLACMPRSYRSRPLPLPGVKVSRRGSIVCLSLISLTAQDGSRSCRHIACVIPRSF